jgi:hypothetical protein
MSATDTTDIDTIPVENEPRRIQGKQDVIALRQRLATEIRGLAKYWATNTLAMGKALKELRDTFPPAHEGKNAHRPGWYECIEQEFGGRSPQWATELINIFETFGAPTRVGADDLPFRVMRELSKSNVPEAAVEEVLAEIKSGKKVTEKQAKQTVKKHKPQRSQARSRHADDHADDHDHAENQAHADTDRESEPDRELPDQIDALFASGSTLRRRIEALTDRNADRRLKAKVLAALVKHSTITKELIDSLRYETMTEH